MDSIASCWKYTNDSTPGHEALIWLCNGQISFIGREGMSTVWHGGYLFNNPKTTLSLLFNARGPAYPLHVTVLARRSEGEDFVGYDYMARRITMRSLAEYTFDWDTNIWLETI